MRKQLKVLHNQYINLAGEMLNQDPVAKDLNLVHWLGTGEIKIKGLEVNKINNKKIKVIND